MDLNTEHYRPIRPPIPARLRLRTPRERRQVRAHVAERGELFRRTVDPLRDGSAAAIAPDLDLEHRERREVCDLRAVLPAEDCGLLNLDVLRKQEGQ